ncbi:ankyrin repeat and MYND domain-containing protein 1-like isoform X4 [Ostrea edulis]|uniref:ankyrin repeat and MYND domain-containing protein 1-like isoform X4 n=1 Tax=Ostrea edulis TaxID=37623 RepID=UPI0024AF3C78|nr:ankyrin repeat and MYND domain-containing protein 1-like isoform X4 [Ostrea edulis]
MSTLSEHLPKLNNAEFEKFPEPVEVQYKSGASYKGMVSNHLRCGQGIFRWPNGARYEGQYSDNARNGKGLQVWQDGGQYEGDFLNDMRHGEGELKWSNEEMYKGTFYKDRRHGKGEYIWPDGSKFTGTFFMDRKEGYGIFTFANGSKFEGLYKDDERMGPGVMTYADNTQDVGLWFKEKLVKICTPINGAFTIQDHKQFVFSPEEHVLYINMTAEKKKPESQEKVLSPDIFDYLPENQGTDKVTDLYNETLDPGSLAINRSEFNREFFRDQDGEKSDGDEKVPAINRTPGMIDIQRHVYCHRNRQKSVSFDVQEIMKGNRGGNFLERGPLETASEDLIMAAAEGKVKNVEDLLTSGKVHPDVADRNGHTALIGASVNWQTDVINVLLNNGANVNQLNDEGCSALSAGTIFFYPIEGFRYNIAERYLGAPPSLSEKEKKLSMSRSKATPSRSKSNASPTKHKSKTPINDHSKSDEKRAAAGISQTSVDNGFPKSESSQSLVTKPQVRIMEPGSRETISQNSEDAESALGDTQQKSKEDPESVDFESTATLHDYHIEVSERMIERCATQLSTNEKIVGGKRSHNSADLGRVRHLAVIKNERERMKSTLDLLLKRGADPNASGVPMPVLFFAIKSADVEVVKTLLEKGASTAITLPKEKGGLAPLHIASAIPGEEGMQITELLLEAGADPDVRATEDDSFLNRTLEEEWTKDVIMPDSQELLGGRTPLQIACARDDNYKNACRVVHLLLEYKANPNLLCNGFSALALSIASGNDLAIDELLLYFCDPSLPLTHGVGSALCAATSTEYEYRRKNINQRLHLIDKLVKAGANILSPIPIGPKRIIGTAVDYAYYMFNQDRRISHMPFHALSHSERATYQARKKLLEHIGNILRTKAVEREKMRMDEEICSGRRSRSPSPGFVYIGAGATLPPDAKIPKSLKGVDMGGGEMSKVTFESKDPSVGRGFPEREPANLPASLYHVEDIDVIRLTASAKRKAASQSRLKTKNNFSIRKPLFKYCYECGRSVGVRLSACTRCKEVYYCGKSCKLAAWKARHSEECIRIGGKSRSPSPSARRARKDSPTPATEMKAKKTTVAELTKGKQTINNIKDVRFGKVPVKGNSKSAKGPRGGRMEEERRVQSEKIHRHWSPPPGVKVDNYSYV